MLPAFDRWLTNGLADMVPLQTNRVGSFGWLITTFKANRKFTETDRTTQIGYDRGLQMVAEYVFQDGIKARSKMIADFDTNFVDAISDKLLLVEEKAADASLCTASGVA